MQNAAPALTTKVSATLPKYTGPLGRFLKKQAEVKDAATQHYATVQAMRANILSLVEERAFFSKAEYLRTDESVHQTDCIVQLQRWFRNVHRLYLERQAALHPTAADAAVSLSLAA